MSHELPDAEWVHTTSPDVREGGLFGWRDTRSETGWLCGYVTQVDRLHLRVRVQNLAAGKLPTLTP